jgi:feruloyl esterase
MLRFEKTRKNLGSIATRPVLALMGGFALFGAVASPQPKATATRTMFLAKASCTSLEGQKIAVSAIGLPTTGASVTSAVLVPAAGERVNNNQVVLAIPEYCKVNGIISPVDPQAPNINFQVNLPTSWNSKIIQLGGSGLNGSIPGALTNTMQFGPESIPPNSPYALSRGFVFGDN